MNIIKKFKNFKKLDLRWKLRTLSKYLRFNIYPLSYPKNFFEKLKYNIVFNLILKNKLNVFKKFYLKNNYEETDKFVVTSLPRSGTHWVMNILKSYFEIIYNLGDGNLKYNPVNDDFKSNIPHNIFDLYNGISAFKDNSSVETLTNFNLPIIDNVGHYPLNLINMKNAEKLNFIILLRNPIDACYSRFLMDCNKDVKLLQNLDLENLKINTQLKNRINHVIEYFNFWEKINLKKKKNKILFIFYENLQKNIEQEISKILNFAKIDMDNLSLKKASELNSKNEIIKKISLNRNSVRITNKDFEKNELRIKEFIKDELKKIKKNFFGYEF